MATCISCIHCHKSPIGYLCKATAKEKYSHISGETRIDFSTIVLCSRRNKSGDCEYFTPTVCQMVGDSLLCMADVVKSFFKCW